MGFNAANANYSCIYCPIHKKDRYIIARVDNEREYCLQMYIRDHCTANGTVGLPVLHIKVNVIIYTCVVYKSLQKYTEFSM